MLGCSKEPSYHGIGSFEYLYHIYIWLKNKKNIFQSIFLSERLLYEAKVSDTWQSAYGHWEFSLCLNREKMLFWVC